VISTAVENKATEALWREWMRTHHGNRTIQYHQSLVQVPTGLPFHCSYSVY